MTVNVSRRVLDALSCIEGPPPLGLLLGYDRGDWYVTGCSRCQKKDPQSLASEIESIHSYLGGGLEVCGMFLKSKSLDITEISRVVQQYFSQLQISVKEAVICAISEKCQRLSEENFFLLSENSQISKSDVTITDRHPVSITTRTKCSFCISLKVDTDQNSLRTRLSSEIQSLCNKIKSDATVYGIEKSSVLFGANMMTGLPSQASCSSLHQYIDKEEDSFTQKKHKKSNMSTEETININLLQRISGQLELEDIPNCAPIIQHNLEKYKKVTINLPCDVIASVSPDTFVTALVGTISTAICHQLISMQNCILSFSQKEKFCNPRPFHFQPWGTSAVVTLTYPDGVSEELLENTRRELHNLFIISPSRPVFRRNNAAWFPEDRARHGYLINPHEGITTTGMKDGQQYLVHGLYSYHHYMQDRFDDNQWGCAYRSLQTLVSWFRFQGYTDKPIPTHREIQQALVDVGDKEPKFVGSKQWIGSMEVSYCLDHLIGVTSRIIFVSEGSEIATKGRELALHFQTQGTPIMIGGGVLAHTILGVDFNEVTGDIKFLILDPHYTEAEDLKVILDKGWCGWKTMDFWNKNAHYNMCLPQRPNLI